MAKQDYFNYSEYQDVLDQNSMYTYKTIGSNRLTFINPIDNSMQGYNLFRIAYKVATASPWDEKTFMMFMDKADVNGRGKNCQLTEYKICQVLDTYNIGLNVVCINETKQGQNTIKILHKTEDTKNLWVIFYKSGVKWKLAVQPQNKKLYPLFTTNFIKELNPSPASRKEDLDNTCIPLTEEKRKSTTSSRRRRNKSDKRRVQQSEDDEKFAKRLQEEYLKNEFGGANVELEAAKNKFYKPTAQRSILDQLLTLKKIRPAPRRVSKHLSSLRRKIAANDALETRVYEAVKQEFEPKSKSRRQSKAPKAPVVSDEDLAREYALSIDAGLGTPTRLKKK